MKRPIFWKILVFGGAFDPIHDGHLALLRRARQEIKPNQTLIIPTGDIPVHKRKTLLPAKERAILIQNATRKMSATTLLTYEIKRKHPAYAWHTLNFIFRKFPNAEIYFLLGSDNLPSLSSWFKIKEILKYPRLTFVIGRRRGARNFKCGVSPGKVRFLRGAFPKVASSVLRQEENLPELITACIRFRLPDSRYRHTLACAKLAMELARHWKADVRKAQIAALLHDISRTQEKFLSAREAIAHGPKSARLAQKLFGIYDKEVLEAIASHTTGRPHMGKLAQILYLADLGSYDRKFKEAKRIRELARKNLRLALALGVRVKIDYLRQAGQPIHPRTFQFLKSLGTVTP